MLRPIRPPLCAILLLVVLSSSATAQDAHPVVVASFTPLFEFHSGFWLNLHHFLYTLGRAQLGLDVGRENVALVRGDTSGLRTLTPEQRHGFDRAVTYYVKSVAPLDLFDRRMIEIKTSLGDREDLPSLRPSSLPDSLVEALIAAAPAYRALWWPRHDASNRAWATAILTMLGNHGNTLAHDVTAAFHEQWAFPIRVDLSAYSSWAGAYTTLYPDRITISTLDPDYHDASALEMIFHESLHTFADSVNAALERTAVQAHVSIPRDLTHAMIFYTAGVMTQRELGTSYQPYAFRLGVWTRGQFPAYLPILRTEWQPYLESRRTFDDAIEGIVRQLRTPR